MNDSLTSPRLPLIALAAAGALTLAACGGSDDSPTPAPEPAPERTVTESDPSVTVDTQTSADDGSADAPDPTEPDSGSGSDSGSIDPAKGSLQGREGTAALEMDGTTILFTTQKQCSARITPSWKYFTFTGVSQDGQHLYVSVQEGGRTRSGSDIKVIHKEKDEGGAAILTNTPPPRVTFDQAGDVRLTGSGGRAIDVPALDKSGASKKMTISVDCSLSL